MFVDGNTNPVYDRATLDKMGEENATDTAVRAYRYTVCGKLWPVKVSGIPRYEGPAAE
jgi:hypothetical protein